MNEEKRYKILVTRQKVKDQLNFMTHSQIVDFKIFKLLKNQLKLCDNLLRNYGNKLDIAN